MMSMDLLHLGTGMVSSGPTYMNRSCHTMINNAAAGCGGGVGGTGVCQPLDDSRSKLQQQQHQLFDSVSKSPGGSGSRGMGQASMGGGFFPFTNSQWNELERQAMVFKYMMHSIPVPYDLLFPFMSSAPTDPSGMMVRRDTHLLKLLKNGDPEPGRCRRTDGKKWRCANAVAIDQKYCEKHVHRGRPRSRKHVEAAASDLNKIHKKPCVSQAQNQSSICPQVSVSRPNSGPRNGTGLNAGGFSNGAFQLLSGEKPSVSVQSPLRNGALSDEQWQQLMQYPQHHQWSLDSFTQQPKQEDEQVINLFLNPSPKKPTSAHIDTWTLNSNSNTSNAQHDLVSLGLSMGHGSYNKDDVYTSETKQDETRDWLGQSGGPLGEVLRPPLTPSPNTANGASSSHSCTGILQEAVDSLSDGARHTSSAPSTFSNKSESGFHWFHQDKFLEQNST